MGAAFHRVICLPTLYLYIYIYFFLCHCSPRCHVFIQLFHFLKLSSFVSLYKHHLIRSTYIYTYPYAFTSSSHLWHKCISVSLGFSKILGKHVPNFDLLVSACIFFVVNINFISIYSSFMFFIIFTFHYSFIVIAFLLYFQSFYKVIVNFITMFFPSYFSLPVIVFIHSFCYL